jgi:hypothetical protein
MYAYEGEAGSVDAVVLILVQAKEVEEVKEGEA